MRIDAHVHMNGEEKDSGKLMKNLERAGFDGAVLFSPSPNALFGKKMSNQERLEHLLQYTRGRDLLYPFYFVDPTEEDAEEQVKAAKEAGVKGYKIICNHFYPGDERAIMIYQWIADHKMPLMFHSGILYDGINVSGKYNRPCEFERLLSIKGLKFSLAHISWPWTGECIAVFGKFNCFKEQNPDGKAASMFLDLTPGTPPTFREDALRHVFGNGFHVDTCTFWGSDNVAEDYNWEYAKQIRERDEEIFGKLGLSQTYQDDIFQGNFRRFLEE
ncbi:MAG TPA: hypothetical protein IAA57_03490 [Candidatus Pullilachnospira intestinigallinarum]|nr:hypothetical protein [Candidatus Pullilachnospira intestinigallinarum]